MLVPGLLFAFFASSKSTGLALLLLAIVPLVPLTIGALSSLLQKRQNFQYSSFEQLSAHFLDSLGGLTDIKASVLYSTLPAPVEHFFGRCVDE